MSPAGTAAAASLPAWRSPPWSRTPSPASRPCACTPTSTWAAPRRRLTRASAAPSTRPSWARRPASPGPATPPRGAPPVPLPPPLGGARPGGALGRGEPPRAARAGGGGAPDCAGPSSPPGLVNQAPAVLGLPGAALPAHTQGDVDIGDPPLA